MTTPPQDREIVLAPWRPYLAAFDAMLDAKQRHKPAEVSMARRGMIAELLSNPEVWMARQRLLKRRAA